MPYPLSFYLLDMFMFNAFSVYHSLCQSVTGIALFIFWLLHQEFSFPQKFNTIPNICLAFQNIFYNYSFCVTCRLSNKEIIFCVINVDFLITINILSVCFSVCIFVNLIFYIYYSVFV